MTARISDSIETETIDKLFLELSQVTSARTKTEIALTRELEAATKRANNMASKAGVALRAWCDNKAEFYATTLEQIAGM